ncbi:hypothetical protein LWI28_019813 [Acer negundo]|uniref:Uncharacterized protein n=1 Tax=Acer negundo TaxID=4023 RepID=A0AAD5NM04_ACENE|nr:hypothetical protein LWI28_019813 [Acer negundo]
MDLEDTHIDAYLLILRKRQRAYHTVYAQRVNVLDSQFYSWLDIQWEWMFGSLPDEHHGRIPWGAPIASGR